MAFCISCSKKLKDGARFCPFCGAEQTAEEPSGSAAEETAGKEEQNSPQEDCTESGKSVSDVEYVAFISYRHRPLDRKAAVRIQRSIESYVVPKGLRAKPNEKKLGRVFRDEDELPISSDLSESITYALDHTRYLIVICTPDLPLSRWCEQEIRYFIQTHDRDHVIAVLAEGTPETSFSPLMLHTFDGEGNPLSSVEPLAANIAGENGGLDNRKYRKEIYRVYAALLGCRFDELWQRAKRANARRVTALLAAASALMTAFSIFLISKNTTIRKQNELIAEKNEELTARISSVQTDLGFSNLAEHYVRRAKENGLRAIEDAGDLYDRRAEKLLLDALNAYQLDTAKGDVVFEQEESIVDLETVEGEDLAVLLDSKGTIICVDALSGQEIWRHSVPAPEADTGFSYVYVENSNMSVYSELLPILTEGVIIYKDYGRLIALSLKDGSEIWVHKYDISEDLWGKKTNLENNSFRALSQDGKLLAVLDKENAEDTGVRLMILDAETGAEYGRTELDFDARDSVENWYWQAGAFTEDNSAIAVALCAEEGYRYYALDLETMRIIDSYADDKLAHSIVYGIHYDRESGDLFTAQLQARKGGIVTSVFRKDGARTSEFTYHTISSRSGKYMEQSLYDIHTQPMLTREGNAYVLSDEIVLIFDMKTGKLRNFLDVSGRIVDSGWTEGEEPSLYLLADNGSTAAYRIVDGSTKEALIVFSDTLNVGLGKLYKDHFQSIAKPLRFVSVPAGQDGQLIAVSSVSDPTAQRLDLPCEDDELVLNSTSFQLSPSRERVFAFFSVESDDNCIACSYDAATMLPVASVTFLKDTSAEPCVLDDEHFIYCNVIYGMDGSEKKLPDSDGKDIRNFYYHSIQMADGSLLTWCDYEKKMPPKIWLNGEEIRPEQGKEHELEYEASFCAGGNGLIVCSGSDVEDGSQKAWFIVYDVHQEKTDYIRDEYPAAENRQLTAGTEKPYFASVYDGERVVLYDMETGNSRALEGEFHEEEILMTCFSEGDEYFLILTRKGVLWCYDTVTGKLYWSGAVIEDTLYIDNIDWIEGIVLSDGRFAFTAHTSQEEAVIIDMEHDIILSKITLIGTVNVMPKIGRILYADRDYVCAFDLHMKEDILRLAREGLD